MRRRDPEDSEGRHAPWTARASPHGWVYGVPLESSGSLRLMLIAQARWVLSDQMSSAWSRSASRSSTCSSPIDRRSSPGGVRLCGPSIDCRCSMRLSTPPRLVARVNNCVRAARREPPARARHCGSSVRAKRWPMGNPAGRRANGCRSRAAWARPTCGARRARMRARTQHAGARP